MSAGSMSPWKARLFLAAMGVFFLGGAVLVFWSAAPARVQCEFKTEGRVDVTAERRMLGWLTCSSETIPDVVKAQSESVMARRGSGEKGSRTKYVVTVTSRDGSVKRVSGVESSWEGGPKSMAQRIDEYVRGPSRSPLVFWSVSWVLNLLGVLLGIVSLFMFLALAEGLLRAVGVLKPATAPR